MTDLKSTKILAPKTFYAPTYKKLDAAFDMVTFENKELAGFSEAQLAEITGLATFANVSAQMMDKLPNLEIIASFGVGYDTVDADYAAKKGIMVTNTPDVLTDEVADTTLGLLLMTVREFGQAEQHLRAGRWEKDGPYPLTKTTLRQRSVGIMGLGRIGLAIAARLEPFGVPISYHNRSKRDDVAYAYHDTLEGLAAAVDTLIVAAPGGGGTDKAVNAAVLTALGSDGVLINIGRGTIVDEDALIEALEKGTIARAGLDVFEREPHVPERLMKAPNTTLLPHVASASHHTRGLMGDLVVDNLKAWFSGQPAKTPVGEVAKTGLTQRKNG